MIKLLIKNHPLYSSAVIFGVLGALNTFLLFFFFYGMGIYPFSDYHFFEFLLVGLFIVLGMVYYRQIKGFYEFHFWQGLASGFLINLIISVVYAVFMYLFLSFAQPEFFKIHVKTMTEKWEGDKKQLLSLPNMTLESYTETLTAIGKTTPTDIALDEFIKKGMFGSVIFFAASILLRRKIPLVVEEPKPSLNTKK
jgi:hypothetical protein